MDTEIFMEIHDSALRGYILGMFKKNIRENYRVSYLIKVNDKWLMKLAKLPSYIKGDSE